MAGCCGHSRGRAVAIRRLGSPARFVRGAVRPCRSGVRGGRSCEPSGLSIAACLWRRVSQIMGWRQNKPRKLCDIGNCAPVWQNRKPIRRKARPPVTWPLLPSPLRCPCSCCIAHRKETASSAPSYYSSLLFCMGVTLLPLAVTPPTRLQAPSGLKFM
jgi:hypothetical protein